MGFFKKLPDFDLGELNIENMFITDFMPSASGTNVKIYLLGLMFSKDENTKYHYDNKTLANMLSLPLQDIHEAWIYWEKVGLIRKHSHEDASEYDVEFLSIRTMYIQNNFTQKNQTPVAQTRKSTTENPFKNENERFKTLTQSIEKIIGHPLTYAEYREISDFYENYSKDVEWLKRAFIYCYQERNMRSLKAVKSILLSWLDQNLTTVHAVEDFLISQSSRFQIYKEILRLLGLSYRMVNQAEKDAIDKWVDLYHIEPDDLYAFVKDFSKKTLTINFSYIDKALTSLQKSGITTYESYTNMQTIEKTQPRTTQKRKTFTIEKEKTYSDEELESLLLNKKR